VQPQVTNSDVTVPELGRADLAILSRRSFDGLG
jgi:hypothetical protein